MQRKRGEIQVFSVSFLDVLTNVLGVVMILLLYTMRYSQEGQKQAKLFAGQAEQAIEDATKFAGESKDYKKAAEYFAGQAREYKQNADKFAGEAKDYKEKAEQHAGEAIQFKKKADQHAAEAKEFKEQAERYASDAKEYKSKADQFAGESKEYKKKADKFAGEATAYKKEADQNSGTVKDLNDKLGDANKKVDDARRATNDIVGLKGKMENVVFICDTSQSMGYEENSPPGRPPKQDPERFESYKGLLKKWLTLLQFKNFAVIDFDTFVRSFPEGDTVELLVADKKYRESATQFVEKFKADGRTNTRGALQRALEFKNVDTIILFSDGEPTDLQTGDPDKKAIREIPLWLETHHSNVVVNTVAIGEKAAEKEFGRFLQLIATKQHGRFIALDPRN